MYVLCSVFVCILCLHVFAVCVLYIVCDISVCVMCSVCMCCVLYVVAKDGLSGADGLLFLGVWPCEASGMPVK